MKHLIFFNISWKLGCFQERKDTFLKAYFKNYQYLAKYLLFKFKFQNGVNPEADIFWTFLRQTALLHQKPPNNLNINANS